MTTSEDSAASQRAASEKTLPDQNGTIGAGGAISEPSAVDSGACAVTAQPFPNYPSLSKVQREGYDTTSDNALVTDTTLPNTLTKGKGIREGLLSEHPDTSVSIYDDTLISLKSVFESTPEETKWFWGGRDGQGVIPDNKLVIFAGAAGEGKSTMAFTLISAAMSGGRTFLGWPVAPIKRAMIVTETDLDQVKDIFTDACIAEPAKENVGVVFSALTAQQLEEKVALLLPEVLILDSMSAFASSLGIHGPQRFDWFSPQDSTDVVRWFRDLLKKYEMKSIILLAHTNKPGRDKDGKRVTGDPHLADLRGTGALGEQVDEVYTIRPSIGGSPGSMHSHKRRKRGIIHKMRFAYDNETGIFITLRDKLDEEGVIEAVKNGTRSRDGLAAVLHAKRETVGQLVKEMIESGLLEDVPGKGGGLKVK